MGITVNPFPANSNLSMNSYKLTGLAAPTESGDAVRWDDLQIGLAYIIGVEWDTSSSSPVLKHIDAYKTEITKTAEQWTTWFNAHPIHGNMKTCLLSVAGVPTVGSNARGDGLTLDGSAGQVMVRIPAFYVKSEKIGTIIRWWISPIPFTGFELHPAFVQRGGTARAQIYVGAYASCLAITPVTGVKYLISKTNEQPFTGECIVELPFNTGSSAPVIGDTLVGATSASSGIVIGHYVSAGSFVGGDAVGKVYLKQPGVATALFTNPEDINRGGGKIMATTGTGAALSFTRQLAETYGNNIGSTRWGCENIWTLDAITMLYLIEYGNWNSQSLSVGIGQGIVNKAAGTGFAGENNGKDSIDSNIAINGTGKGTGTDGLTPIAYRGIKNMWGNVWQFVIGYSAVDAAHRVLNRNGTGVPACPMTGGNYESSVAAPITYNDPAMPDGYVKDILYEDLTKYLFIANLAAGSSSTYLCDYIYWHRSGQVNILLAGGAWNFGAFCGVGYRYAGSVASAYYRHYSSRLEFI